MALLDEWMKKEIRDYVWNSYPDEGICESGFEFLVFGF